MVKYTIKFFRFSFHNSKIIDFYSYNEDLLIAAKNAYKNANIFKNKLKIFIALQAALEEKNN